MDQRSKSRYDTQSQQQDQAIGALFDNEEITDPALLSSQVPDIERRIEDLKMLRADIQDWHANIVMPVSKQVSVWDEISQEVGKLAEKKRSNHRIKEQASNWLGWFTASPRRVALAGGMAGLLLVLLVSRDAGLEPQPKLVLLDEPLSEAQLRASQAPEEIESGLTVVAQAFEIDWIASERTVEFVKPADEYALPVIWVANRR